MNITTIIPVHEYSEDINMLLNKALDTVSKQDKIADERPLVLVVYAAELDKDILFSKNRKEAWENLTVTYLKNEGKTDFQSQMNFAVKSVETDWFTILEFDDELSTTYYKNALDHIGSIEDIDLFLPILVETNENQEILKITNETVWSKQFVGENGEMGYLNVNALNQYTDFKFSGGIFNKEEFEAVGGLKSNIVLTFTYEYLLRVLNNGGNIYIIPKIGLKHFATREGSLFDTYSTTLSINERKFWFDTAKKESNFFNDRVIDMSLLKADEK